MSSRESLCSAAAFLASSMAACASALNFGYGGPNMNELNPALRSTVHVPVRLKGGFGRGFARLAGERAPSGMSGGGDFCVCAWAHDGIAPKENVNAIAATNHDFDRLIFPSLLSSFRRMSGSVR